MADLQMVLAEAVKLNQSISKFLKFSTYTDYDDLSGLDIDLKDGEQLFLRDELRDITDRLADKLQMRIAGSSQSAFHLPCKKLGGRTAHFWWILPLP